MNFKESLSNALDIVKLDPSAVHDVAGDAKATGWAFLIVILAGVANAIGSLMLPGIIFVPLFMVLGLLFGTLVFWVLALLFGGRAGFMELFRPLGHSLVLNWVTVIPFIGPFLGIFTGIWSIVMDVVIVREVFGFTTGRAALVVLIPVVIALIAGLLFAAWAFTQVVSLYQPPVL